MTPLRAYWPADAEPEPDRQPERMLRSLQGDRRSVGTVLAVPTVDDRLFGVAVRPNGIVRLFPPDSPPVDLPAAAVALLVQILDNRPKGGER